jgi:hypothetical protein
MKQELEKIESSAYKNVLNEIKESFYDIPFDNSKFQTEAFVISAEITPERAYRAIGLKLLSNINSLETILLGIKNKQVDLDEIEYNLQHANLNEFQKRREVLKREQIELDNEWLNKLINDAIVELDVLYSHYQKFPKYTREQFEAAERKHYEQRLNRQAFGLEGAAASIINMNEDLPAFQQFEEKIQKLSLENKDLQTIGLITDAMTNRIKQVESLK